VGHGAIGEVAEGLVKRGVRAAGEGVSKAIADFHRATAKGLENVAERTRKVDDTAAKGFKDLEHPIRTRAPHPVSASPRTLAGPSGVREPVTGRVGYGETELSRAVQSERLKDGNRGSNYAAARLDDGSIIKGKSSLGVHAEEDAIAQAKSKDRKILDLYTEREPCANKCLEKTKDMNVTYSWKWNDADKTSVEALRKASNADIAVAIDQLFMGKK